MKKLIFLLVLSNTFFLSAQPQFWFTVYYPTWAMGQLGSAPWRIPPWEVDWNGVTHIVHFHAPLYSQTSPYFGPVVSSNDSIDLEFNGIGNPGNGQWIHWQDSLIKGAHRKGIKVVLSIDGVDPTEWNTITADSQRTNVLAKTAVGYCQRKGYDGLEIDVETWTGTPVVPANLNRAMRIFRTELNKMSPRGLLLNSAMRTQENLYYPSQDSCIDQFVLQCYTYSNVWNPTYRSNSVWYLTPLYRGSACPGSEAQALANRTSISHSPLDWIAAGHPAKKNSIGIGSFGYVYKGQKELCISSGSNPPGYSKYQECLGLLANGGTKGWDDICKVPYIYGTAIFSQGANLWGSFGVTPGMNFFATYEDSASIIEKIAWIKLIGFGGIMIYDLTMDLDGSKSFGQRNPLHKIIGEKISGSINPPLPDYEWSLVSIPVLMPNDSVNTVLPLKMGEVYSYNAGTKIYEPVRTLAYGQGYWVNYPAGTNFTFKGFSLGSLTVPAQPGWNLIGSRSTPVQVSSLVLSNNAKIIEGAYSYNVTMKKFEKALGVNPGTAIWILVDKACTITLP